MGNTVWLSGYDRKRDRVLSTGAQPWTLSWAEQGLRGPELEILYSVPLAWLALFGPDSIHELPEQRLWLVTPVERALERLAARRRAVSDAGGIELSYVLHAFEARLVPALKPCAVARLDQLAIMSGDGVFLAELRTALDAIEDPARLVATDPALRTFTSQERTAGAVYGYGKAWPPKKTTADEDRELHLAWRASGFWQAKPPYSASRTYAKDDSLSHSKFGPGFVVRVLDGKIEVLFEEGRKTLAHGKRS